ncbi:MAG TPA: DUF3151 domain-containing protein [Streptosporangiaceae bacterium]|nr:DUF3151 domain-containing protein [Streptosporangiaceae bacterium]
MNHENLLASATPAPTYLPENEEAASALRAGADPATVAAQFPTHCAAWADLAENALPGNPVAAYAYARTGYHRGLDQLRRAGWRGNGPIPWEHEPNRGFLRALNLLGAAAAAIGEDDEVARISEFLRESSPTAAASLPPNG